MEIPNFYDYEDLSLRRKRGKRTVECKNSYDDVDVLRLLDNVFVTSFFKPRPLKIFVSYSKADKVHLESLQKHLSILRREGTLIAWDDTQLVPGEEWDSRIKQQLATADIIILLVSSDFMATDYIWGEIGLAIQRHERGEALVVPVIVRPCDWSSAPFARFSALPPKAKPVTQWSNADEVWALVAQSIREVSKKLKPNTSSQSHDSI